MDIQQLKKYWDDNAEMLYVYSSSYIDKLKVDNDTFTFLTTCGLPSDAAPFLNFREIKENKLLTPNQILQIKFEGLDNYLMFGSNASGDPICIDTTKSNEVIYLNHDNYFERVFINTNIFQFALCLTTYRDFIISLANTTNNFDQRKFTDIEFEQLKNNFKNIDSNCLLNNCFWETELEGLLWERNNE